MPAELPFPIDFSVPHGWSLVTPESCGHSDAAYVAVRSANAHDRVVTNFAISGFAVPADKVNLDAQAAARLEDLRRRYTTRLLDRTVSNAPLTTQSAHLVEIDYPVADTAVTLKQVQITTVLASAEQQSGLAAVLNLVMTCPAELFNQAGPEFGTFIASIKASPLPGSPT